MFKILNVYFEPAREVPELVEENKESWAHSNQPLQLGHENK